MLQRGVTSVDDGRERKEELLSTLADKRRKINPIRCHEIEEKIIIGQRSGGIFFFCSAIAKFISGYQHCHLVIKGFNTKRNPKSAIAQPLACRRL